VFSAVVERGKLGEAKCIKNAFFAALHSAA